MSVPTSSPPPSPSPPPAPSARDCLWRHKVLSPHMDLRVSPLQFGAASIGDRWVGLGMDKASSFAHLDAYFDAGGNFIDTADYYQDGSSEEFIGEWAEHRDIRNELVIATKYTMNYKVIHENIAVRMNHANKGRKSLQLSVEASLKKLRTSYIDILYVHFWECGNSVEEVMDILHSLVVAGKVLYLGASNLPAWVVIQANQWAKDNGKTPFRIYQGKWSILERSFEREILPMATSQGLALAPYGVAGQGRIRTDKEDAQIRMLFEKGRGCKLTSWEHWRRSPAEVKVSHKLEEIAKEIGAEEITSVAMAYVMHKAPYVFPIIGGRKVEHLYADLEALNITLTPRHIRALEEPLLLDI